MKQTAWIAGCLFVALSTGCKSEIDGKTAAKVEDAKPAETKKEDAPAPDKAAAAATELKLNPDTSSIGFVGAKITGDHKGKFNSLSGTATVTGDKLTALKVVVQTAELESDDEKLTGHLKSPDFFDVAKFPTSTFEATSIEASPGAAAGATHQLKGNLELHGVTKEISFPAKVEVSASSVKGQAEFTINRKDFGITYPGKPDDLIKDDVLLKLDLNFSA